MNVYFFFMKSKETIIYKEKDISAQNKARFESEYRQKQEQMNKELNILQEEALEKIIEQNDSLLDQIREREANLAAEINEKKQVRLKELDEEILARKEHNEHLKLQLEEWVKEQQDIANSEVEQIKIFVEEWRSKQEAVVESFKKLDELKNEESFHRIVLSEDEETELIELNKAIRKLRNPLPFRKAVYSIYYQPKINEMCLRVVGRGRKSGIYKITHMESGKTYVGQSVDISNRWKQHSKRGAGADVLTANKLYPEMLKYGLESFMFEVIEETKDTSKLNEMETYWQDYFKSKEFGYSMK